MVWIPKRTRLRPLLTDERGPAADLRLHLEANTSTTTKKPSSAPSSKASSSATKPAATHPRPDHNPASLHL